MLYIPITPVPNQEFKVALDDQTVLIRMFWSANSQSWYMDINGVSTDLVVTGIRMAVDCFLLDGLAIREIGDFVVLDLEDEQKEPDYDGLGTRWLLCYFTREELGYDTF